MTTAPLLTVLNFSGGRQSSALLWMVLLEIIPRPANFVVLNADPGMEAAATYDYVAMMFGRSRDAGIDCRTVAGPNLYEDILSLRKSNCTRLDNPPYWTKSPSGKRGRLKQCCTKHYKIRPMDREIRRILAERHGISPKAGHLGSGIVEKWIGFSASEMCRIKPSPQKYVTFRYPLIEMGLNNADVEAFFAEHQLPLPPRSVCNACFANTIDTFREMRANRPHDWQQAVAVDRAVRDWKQIGVEDEVYVSHTLLSLEELAARNFQPEPADDDIGCHAACQSGYCFN